MIFDITYKHGLMNPITVEAEDAKEAAKLGLAAYRKNCTSVTFTEIDEVVASVTLSDKKAFQHV